jgi:hypothetical protein
MKDHLQLDVWKEGRVGGHHGLQADPPYTPDLLPGVQVRHIRLGNRHQRSKILYELSLSLGGRNQSRQVSFGRENMNLKTRKRVKRDQM